VTLLEFWTTWCPSCRSDQAALDDISREFSGQGLVVLAVDAYESGDTVKKYLQQHPRSCNVVLNQDTTLIAAFKPTSFPLYVLIDRDGNIAGTQDGAGGDLALLDLLSNAGLRGTSARSRRSSDQESAVPTITHSVSPKLIEAPRGRGAPLLKSVPPTVFVLKSGERLEAHRYTIMAGSLRIDEQGTQRTIPLSALDLKATIAENHKRGIDLKIPLYQNEVLLGF
jgi:thiol-disulfide isomerase/thioredoxin